MQLVNGDVLRCYEVITLGLAMASYYNHVTSSSKVLVNVSRSNI